MEERILSVGDTIYVIYSPNSRMNYYRYYKCKIIFLQAGWSVSTVKNRPLYDSINLKDINNLITEHTYSRDRNLLTVGIEYTIPKTEKLTHNYLQLNKDLCKIYFADEVDIVEKDVENLNKILEVKNKQKQELQEYIKSLLVDWDYRGKNNLI